MHFAEVRSMKVVIITEGRLPEKEETEIRRVDARKRAEKPRIIDPARAYMV
jgi:hypothetical protein